MRNPDFLLVTPDHAPLPYLMLAEECMGVQPLSRPPMSQVKDSIQVKRACTPLQFLSHQVWQDLSRSSNQGPKMMMGAGFVQSL